MEKGEKAPATAAVVGGGIVGLACAFELQSRGIATVLTTRTDARSLMAEDGHYVVWETPAGASAGREFWRRADVGSAEVTPLICACRSTRRRASGWARAPPCPTIYRRSAVAHARKT
jgi:2-polyprenyl-6-methoxyphenol hydroxylase-like FAD-dependent oxidoreductase